MRREANVAGSRSGEDVMRDLLWRCPAGRMQRRPSGHHVAVALERRSAVRCLADRRRYWPAGKVTFLFEQALETLFQLFLHLRLGLFFYLLFFLIDFLLGH